MNIVQEIVMHMNIFTIWKDFNGASVKIRDFAVVHLQTTGGRGDSGLSGKAIVVFVSPATRTMAPPAARMASAMSPLSSSSRAS